MTSPKTDIYRPPFKIVVAPKPYLLEECLKSRYYRRFNFLGLAAIASMDSIHIFTEGCVDPLLPKYPIELLSRYDINVVNMAGDVYDKYVSDKLKEVTRESDIKTADCRVVVVCDEIAYCFYYAEDYKGPRLTYTHIGAIMEHYKETLNDPNVKFSANYCHFIPDKREYSDAEVLNDFIAAVNGGSGGLKTAPESKPELWFGRGDVCAFTGLVLMSGDTTTTQAPQNHTALQLISILRSVTPSISIDDTLRLLREHLYPEPVCRL